MTIPGTAAVGLTGVVVGLGMTATEYTVVISAVSLAIVNIIAAIKTNAKVKETHDAVNSRMDKFLIEQKAETERLLKTAVVAAHAEGVKQAVDTQKAVQTIPGVQNNPPGGPQEVLVVNPSHDPVPTIVKKP